MSRPLRIEYEGAYYHITQRGHDRQAIFRQDRDYERFLLYLTLASRSYGIRIHAYCLLTNHYHLLIETPKANLSKAMHAINTGYSLYYNKKYQRRGALYQGRYGYCIVERDEYLHHVSRYIHLNPVRAKIVERPEDYRWSSYRAYISGRGEIEGLETEFILGMFGKQKKEARKRYKSFVEDEMDVKGAILKENTIRGMVIGGMDFFKEIKDKYVKNRTDAEIPMIREAQRADDEGIRGIVEECVDEEVSAARKRRKLKIYFTRRYTQYDLKEIAGYYGDITYSGVSQICRRVDDERRRDKRLAQVLNRIEKKMSNVKT